MPTRNDKTVLPRTKPCGASTAQAINKHDRGQVIAFIEAIDLGLQGLSKAIRVIVQADF